MKKLIISLIILPLQADVFTLWSEWNAENRKAITNFVMQHDSNTAKRAEAPKQPVILSEKSYVGGFPQEIHILKESLKPGSSLKRPKGILLEGLPGTGKTYLVRCFAGEVDAEFIQLDAASLMDMWVGTGPQKIRDTFKRARELTKKTGRPVIIFFDEFDSIGKRADTQNGSSIVDEINKTVNALLAEIDGFMPDDTIIVIGATNRAENIDLAFKRPGRFDYTIRIDLPDAEKRKKILLYYRSEIGVSFDETVNLDELVELTEGFSGADLKQIILDVANRAILTNRSLIRQEDLLTTIHAQRATHPHAAVMRSAKDKLGERNVTFNDIIGGVPQEILDLKSFLENDESFRDVGAEKPKGIILQGPPGSGKTMLVKALANEIDAAFFAVSAASFVQLYVGSGPKAVRELFEQARRLLQEGRTKQAIIFIDEIDALGTRSSSEFFGSENTKTINELLVQMDGFVEDDRITVIGATNRIDMLDDALLRSGRFDWMVKIPLPDIKKRRAIIEHYLTKKPRKLDPMIDLDFLAAKTEDFNCADLKELVNKAALIAVRQNHSMLMADDMYGALQHRIKTRKNKTI